MKKITSLLIFYISINSLFAQINLVPNSGFENHTACPLAWSEFYKCTSWFSPARIPAGGFPFPLATPDYFNACSSPATMGVPTHLCGYLNDHSTGQAYAGLITSGDTTITTTNRWREYIEVRLKRPLIAGRTYYYEMYIAFEDSSGAISDIGALITDTLTYQNYTRAIPIAPSPTATIIRDNGLASLSGGNWVRISDTITGRCGQKYLTIGRFAHRIFSDMLGDIDTLGVCTPIGQYAYFYIDDVEIIPFDSLLYASLNFPDSIVECKTDKPCDTLRLFNDSAFNYNWFRNGIPIIGATSNELEICNNTGLYYAMLSNLCDTIYSDTVYVAVGNSGNMDTTRFQMPYTKCDTTAQFLILNPQTDVTYTWSCPNLTPSFFIGGTYNATWTNFTDIDTVHLIIKNAYGCIKDTSFAVWYCCIPKAVCTDCNVDDLRAYMNLDSSYTLDTISFSCINIDGTFVINRDVIFNNIIFSMDPYSRIIIQAGKSVIFDSCKLIACDTVMWQGIFISGNSSSLNMHHSILEHAITGIDISNNPIIELFTDTFNYNYRDLWIHKNTVASKLNVHASSFENKLHNTDWDCLNRYGVFADRLYNPYNFQNSHIAIQIDTNFSCTVGNYTNASDVNYFNLHEYGIYAKNTNLNVFNNYLENLIKDDPTRGIGVYAYARHPLPFTQFKTVVGRDIYNGGNKFYNMNVGVFARGTHDSIIKNYIENTVEGIHLDSSSNLAPFNIYKSICYWDTIIKYKDVGILNEQNKRAIIHIIECGIIQPLDATLTGGTAILINQFRPSFVTTDSTYTTACFIRNNYIYNPRFGIRVWNRSFLNIIDNYIHLNRTSIYDRIGIRLNNVHNSYVGCNAIIGDEVDTSITGNRPLTGINLQDSRRNQLDCNTTDSTQFGLKFISNCYGQNMLARNTMKHHYDQLYLSTNGTIGPQINRTVGGFRSLDNTFWPAPGRSNTFCFNSFGGAYAFRGQSFTLPTINLFFPFMYSSINPLASTWSSYTCPLSCLGLRFRFGEDEESNNIYAKEAIQENITSNLSSAEFNYSAKQDAYSLIISDSSLLDSSFIIATFYEEMQAQNLGKFYEIENLMDIDNYTDASIKNNALIPENKIEENAQLFNNILFNFEENANEMWSDITYIANQCPISGGKAVYEARALLLMYDKNLDWDDETACIQGVDYKKAPINNIEPTAIIYPNPVNEQLTIWLKNYKIKENESIEIQLIDIIGNTIHKYHSDLVSKILELDTKKLATGNYIIQITTSTGLSINSKFNVYH